jgi:alpha-1,6-mannosyltransferase
VIPRFAAVQEILERVKPDSIEVSDKATLTAAGRWARERGIGSVLISHERLDAVAAARIPNVWRGGQSALRPLARYWNRRLAAGFDTIVAASAFSEAEFSGLGVTTRRVPLGVDLDTFRPTANPTPNHPTRLIYVGRLSPEKNPYVPIAAVRHLISDGIQVRLDVYGEGSERANLQRVSAGLPVTFHGHVANRSELAAAMARADIAFAVGPAETFGLAALEALACGTPVITANTGASPELLTHHAGIASPLTPIRLAEAVVKILSWPTAERRGAARRRAEEFPWSATVDAMLDIHCGLARDCREPRESRHVQREPLTF